jgi:ATP-dependent RNA helicase DDX46/PRP5
LVKALEQAKQEVPPELKDLADSFAQKKQQGLVKGVALSGYRTKGFKFDEAEAQKKYEEQKRQMRTLGIEGEDESDDDLGLPEFDETFGAEEEPERTEKEEEKLDEKDSIAKQIALAKKLASAAKDALNPADGEQAKKIAEVVSMRSELSVLPSSTASQASGPSSTMIEMPEHEYCMEEVDINDYAQQARFKVTNKQAVHQIQEWADVAITVRGSHFPSGRKPGPGERRLHLVIEGKSRIAVNNAKREIKRLLEEASDGSTSLETPQYSRFSVV